MRKLNLSLKWNQQIGISVLPKILQHSELNGGWNFIQMELQIIYLYSKSEVKFKVEFTITVSSRKYTKNLTTRCEEDCRKGWGWSRFCSSSELKSKSNVLLTIIIAMKIVN